MQTRLPEDEPRYDLELLGFPGRPPQVAAAGLAPPFGITREEALRYVEEAPLLVVKGATEPVLCAYVRALHEAGADLRVLSRDGQTWVLPAPIRIQTDSDDSAPFAGALPLEEGDTVPTWLAAQTSLLDDDLDSDLGDGPWRPTPQVPLDDFDLPDEDDDFIMIDSAPPAAAVASPRGPTGGQASVAPTPGAAPAAPRASGDWASAEARPSAAERRVETPSGGRPAASPARTAAEVRGASADVVAQRVSGSHPEAPHVSASYPAAPHVSASHPAVSGSRPAVEVRGARAETVARRVSGSTPAVPPSAPARPAAAAPGAPGAPGSPFRTATPPPLAAAPSAPAPPGESSSLGKSSSSLGKSASSLGGSASRPPGSVTPPPRPDASSTGQSSSSLGQSTSRPPGKGARAKPPGPPPGSRMIPVSARHLTDEDSRSPRVNEPPAPEKREDHQWMDRVPTGEVFSQGLVLLRQQREERGESIDDLLRRTASSFGTRKGKKKPR